jgi:hypothetical protein
MKFQAWSTALLFFVIAMASPPTNVDWPPLIPAIGVTPMSASARFAFATPARLAGIGMMPMVPFGK